MSRCLSCGGPDNLHEPHCQQERDSLRAENARLQTDLKVAQHHWKACEVGWNKAIKQVEDFVRERDGYKALAEQRMEALRLLKLTQAILHGYACQQEDDCLEACEMTRTFLADTSACDAETAVLVVALKAYTDDSGWHAREMGPLGPTHDKLYRDGLAALLDPSPAAAVLLAQGERQRKALGHALHLVEHNKANCARCREAHKLIRAALAPREK